MKTNPTVRSTVLSVTFLCVLGTAFGCIDEISVTDIQFEKAVFSPDKDGVNDTVKVTVKTKIEITNTHYNDTSAAYRQTLTVSLYDANDPAKKTIQTLTAGGPVDKSQMKPQADMYVINLARDMTWDGTSQDLAVDDGGFVPPQPEGTGSFTKNADYKAAVTATLWLNRGESASAGPTDSTGTTKAEKPVIWYPMDKWDLSAASGCPNGIDVRVCLDDLIGEDYTDKRIAQYGQGRLNGFVIMKMVDHMVQGWNVQGGSGILFKRPRQYSDPVGCDPYCVCKKDQKKELPCTVVISTFKSGNPHAGHDSITGRIWMPLYTDDTGTVPMNYTDHFPEPDERWGASNVGPPDFFEDILGHEAGHAFMGFRDPQCPDAMLAPGRYVASYWASGTSSLDQVWWNEIDAIRHNAKFGYGVAQRTIRTATATGLANWSGTTSWTGAGSTANMKVAPVAQRDESVLVAYSDPSDATAAIRTRLFKNGSWQSSVLRPEAKTFSSPALAHGRINVGGQNVDRTLMVWVQNEGYCPDDPKWEDRLFNGNTYQVWNCEDLTCHGRNMTRLWYAYSDDYGATWQGFKAITDYPHGAVEVAAYGSPAVAFNGQRFALLWRNYFPTNWMGNDPRDWPQACRTQLTIQNAGNLDGDANDCQNLIAYQVYGMVSADGLTWSERSENGNARALKAMGEPSLACDPTTGNCYAVWKKWDSDPSKGYSYLQLVLAVLTDTGVFLVPQGGLSQYESLYDPHITFGDGAFVATHFKTATSDYTNELLINYLGRDGQWHEVNPDGFSYTQNQKVWKQSVVYDPQNGKYILFLN
ncbi:MAG: hypothetical protein HY897_24830 [Deltaproteobacteria bacterium]|nr:hypothetical protein [Deltaproteobacteria bacterium]